MTQENLIIETGYVIQKHNRDGVFAARLPALGLTGYGKTEEEARNSCDNLYETFIQTHIEKETLTKVLGRAGVRWNWSDQTKN